VKGSQNAAVCSEDIKREGFTSFFKKISVTISTAKQHQQFFWDSVGMLLINYLPPVPSATGEY
jgi:hypothetical protein